MNHTFTCTSCGQENPLDECIHFNEEMLCPACADELTTICDHCGDRIPREDSVYDSNYLLCESCFERYYSRCEDCGHIIHQGDVYWRSDNAYCIDCYDDCESCYIEDYSYRPEPIFYGEGNRFFGLELEIDEGGQSGQKAEQLADIANANAEHVYIKTDGSLDDGLELVTHPMTMEYHMQHMPWKPLLREAVHLGYYSHNCDTCGLHIHVSRSSFGENTEQQEDVISRLLYFVEKFWSELLRFSRRTQRQLNRWAARYGMRLHPKEILDSAKTSCQGRYTAVNLINRETVEFRMCRGTLKPNTLLATLQMVNHICDVAISFSDEQIQDLSWYDFLDRIHEKELITYLKERRLYVNEPVACSLEV